MLLPPRVTWIPLLMRHAAVCVNRCVTGADKGADEGADDIAALHEPRCDGPFEVAQNTIFCNRLLTFYRASQSTDSHFFLCHLDDRNQLRRSARARNHTGAAQPSAT